MLYISRGIAGKHGGKNRVIVNRFGKEYSLEGDCAKLWLSGRNAVQEADGQALQPLLQDGLVCVNSDDVDYLIRVFRILSECILLVDARRIRMGLKARERDTLNWMRNAGIHLTAAELCCLNERSIHPLPCYTGKANRQALVEAIYTGDTIEDGALERAMEASRSLPDTVGALLRLLKCGHIYAL